MDDHSASGTIKSEVAADSKNFQPAFGSQMSLSIRHVVTKETSYPWDEFRRAELPSLISEESGSRTGQEPVHVQIMQKMAVHLKHASVESLATLLMHKDILSAKERALYLQPVWSAGTSKQDHLSCLLIDRAKLPVTAEQCFQALYLSLRDSYEEASSIPTNNHYIIAQLLLDEAKNCIKCKANHTDSFSELSAAIDRVPQSESDFDQTKASRLMQNLGFQSAAKFTSYQQICQHWLDIGGVKCRMGHLVLALVKSGLGRLTSGLQPVYRSNPPRFQNFVMNLSAVGHNWKSLAYFLGYEDTDPEVYCVDNYCPLPKLKPRMFLRVFRLPDCEQEMGSVVAEISSGVINQRKITENKKNNVYQGQEKITPSKQPSKSPPPCTGSESTIMQPGQQTQFTTEWTKGGKIDYSNIASNMYHTDGKQIQGNLQIANSKVQATNSQAMESGKPIQHPTILSSSKDMSQDKSLCPLKIISSSGAQQIGQIPKDTTKQEVQIPHQSDNKQKQLQSAPGKETPSTIQTKPKPTSQTKKESPTQRPQNHPQPRNPPMKLPPPPSYGVRASLLDTCMIGNDWPLVDTILDSMQVLGEELNGDEGKTAFHYVCRDGNIVRVRRMIAKGAKVTHIDKSGQSVLHYNAVLKNEQLLKILLIDFKNNSVSIDVCDKESYLTPLMMVCTIGDSAYGSAKLLLDYGANPNGNPNAHSTPLIVACQSAHDTFELVELLVERGADINKQDKDGYTLLLKACTNRKWNVAKYVLGLSHLITINRSDRAGTNPLFEAVSQNNPEMVELLLSKGARTTDVRLQTNNVPSLGSSSVEETPFVHACRHGMLEIAKLLVKYNVDVNYKCSAGSVPAIVFALVNKKNNIVHYLLHECDKLDTTIFGLSVPIVYSVKVGNDQCTKWMLDKLGGVERAAEEADKMGMTDLLRHINEYQMTSLTTGYEGSTHHSHNTVDTELASHGNDIEHTLYQFSKICMMVVTSKNELSDLASIASAGNPHVPEIGNFFKRCAGGFQDENSYKMDFIGPHKEVSPLSFLIDQRCLSRQKFVHHAELYFKGTSQAQMFIERLVHTFHSISGDTESVSWNGDVVLDRLFNGQFSLSSSRGQPTYGLGAQGRISQPPQRSYSWAPRTTRETSYPAQSSRSADVKPRDQDFEWPTVDKLTQHQASASASSLTLPSSTSHMPVCSSTYSGHEESGEPSENSSLASQPDIVHKTFPSEPRHISKPSSQSKPAQLIYSQADNMSSERIGQSTTTPSTERQEATPTPSSLASYDADVTFDPSHVPQTREPVSREESADVDDKDGIARDFYQPSPNNTIGSSNGHNSIDSPHQTPHRRHHNSESYPKDWGELQCFIPLKEITYPKESDSLGFGRYGSVEVVRYKGKEYAAKSYRKDFNETQRATVIKKFTTEFNILSVLSHENIVEYVGATFKPGCDLPLLIMEKMSTNLQKFLETNPALSLHLKLSILHDTANGLHFLHTRRPKAVIHRDLTATNVLLDSSNRAKIADFGNSCVVDANLAKEVSMTCNPGTPLYSAPEVVSRKYGIPIDIFSFGHLALFTISQEEPQDILIAVVTLESGETKARNEVERRAGNFKVAYRYLELDHAIIKMIKRCLHNLPKRRPTTLEIIDILDEELKKTPDFGTS